MKHTKPSYYLVLFTTMFALAVIILGAYTRLKDAGLGCPDWPGCYGFLSVPTTPEQIRQAEAAFPHAPVEADKAWPEVIHRYVASFLGVLVIAIATMAWLNRKRSDQPLGLPLFLLGLVIAQGLFGMWTVTLYLWPQVVTAHLLGGFATISLLWLLAMRLSNDNWRRPNIDIRHWKKLRPVAALGLVLVVLQIALGGWVSSNYAALACPDFPSCQNQWWPSMDFAHGFNVFQEVGPNYLGGQMESEGRVAIHVVHRIGALVVALYLGFMVWLMHRNAGDSSDMKLQANVILCLLAVQLGLGVSNVVLGLPLWVAVAHNAVGALLLLSLVTLNYRLYRSTAHVF